MITTNFNALSSVSILLLNRVEEGTITVLIVYLVTYDLFIELKNEKA